MVLAVSSGIVRDWRRAQSLKVLMESRHFAALEKGVPRILRGPNVLDRDVKIDRILGS